MDEKVKLKKAIIKEIMGLVVIIGIGTFLFTACSDSETGTAVKPKTETGITLKMDVTVGEYPSNGKELTCPRQKLERSY